MTRDAAPLRATEMSQVEFFMVMDAASDGLESAVRCYVRGDRAAVIRHLDAVDEGSRLIRSWTSDA